MDEEKEPMEDEDSEQGGKVKSWLQDNLRILISIIIVIVIAGGVYSYSKRTQAPTGQEEATEQAITEENPVEVQPGEEGTAAPQGTQTPEQVAPKKEQVTSAATSKETETSFVEAAERGDGVTKLARKALANYLEKNPDSSLTPEHKIYIEDYLRKNVGFHGRVYVGTSVEFSKDLIRQSIEQSKQLNERQLTNLHKYAVRVPSLS